MFARKYVPVVAVLAALLIAPLAHAATAAAKPSTPPAAHEMKAPAVAKPMATSRVDLNTATREELVALPQIGEVKADKIIAARPFKMKSDLIAKGIVTKAEYAKLASHVIAKQGPEAPKPAYKAAKPETKAALKAAK
jgi:competence protein ComEA